VGNGPLRIPLPGGRGGGEKAPLSMQALHVATATGGATIRVFP
jgi:hypothetical protein